MPAQSVDDLACGRFRVLERVGRGATADVFRAEDVTTGDIVALKALRADSGDRSVRRFARELHVWSQLRHPAIVGVRPELLDWRQDELRSVPCIVLDFLSGGSLHDQLVRVGRMSEAEVLELVVPLAAALATAHRHGLVHRDVKPQNILLDELGNPQLADFGLAHIVDGTRLTRVGELLGTPAYAPLAQLKGDTPRPWWDVHALGATMIHMLTGDAVAASTRPEHLRDLGTSEALAEFVLDCTSNDPSRCPADGAAALRRLVELSGRRVAEEPTPGRTIVDGRYELGALLGSGRTSRVFRAVDRTTGKDVALKFLLDEELRGAAADEIRALSNLSHPRIVRLLGHGTWVHAGTSDPYLALAFVDGTPLADVMGEPLGVDRAVQWSLQLLGALEHAHGRGVVHLDISPSNIIVDAAGDLHLIDFGFAHHLDATGLDEELVAATWWYGAPERFSGTAGPAADLWSVAAIFHEVMTGQRVRRASATVSAGHVALAPLELDISRLGGFRPLLDHALAPDPDERFRTAAAMANAVRASYLRARSGS